MIIMADVGSGQKIASTRTYTKSTFDLPSSDVMEQEELIELLMDLPKRIRLSDGRRHDVYHPELAIVGEHSIAIGLPSKGDPTRAGRITICSLAHIIEVEPLEAPASRNGDAADEAGSS
jgi:hypothetical protein